MLARRLSPELTRILQRAQAGIVVQVTPGVFAQIRVQIDAAGNVAIPVQVAPAPVETPWGVVEVQGVAVARMRADTFARIVQHADAHGVAPKLEHFVGGARPLLPR